MIARFDHRPRLTAALALATIVLLVVVVTLSTLLITAAPPAAPALSGSVGDNAPVIGAGGEFYGDGWSNYGHNLENPPAVFPSERYEGMWNDDGHDFDQPKPAQIGNGADLSAIDRRAEMVASYNK